MQSWAKAMNGPLALLVFQFRSGARLSMRTFVPLFCAALALIMIQMYPAELVRLLARRAFARDPGIDENLVFVLLAFVLPAWSAPRLSRGLLGWMRHLPLSDRAWRLGLAAALVTVQFPLVFTLALFAIVAHAGGQPILSASTRWPLVLMAGAVAALPVARQWLCIPAAVVATGMALWSGSTGPAAALPVLAAGVGLSGRMRKVRPGGVGGGLGRFFEARIAWRALGWRTGSTYLPALVVWGAALLFIRNNELAGSMGQSAARFGACLSVAVLLGGLADRLAVVRPPWPWARSLPLSSARRVASDAAFLAFHAMPLLALQAYTHPWGAAAAAAALPLLALRAVDCMRRSPEACAAAVSFLAEGFALSAIAALLGWSVLFLPALAVPAFYRARQADWGHKVTRWLELHHAAAGDSQSWEGQ